MILSDALDRLLTNFPPEEREVPDSGTYPGRNGACISAVNSALQELYGAKSPWTRRGSEGFLLYAPTVITATVTNGSKEISIPSWEDWYAGATIRINGATTDNKIISGSAAVPSSVILNPDGANNSILLTAATPGTEGDSITCEIALDSGGIETDGSELTVTVDGNSVLVTAGTKHRMEVTGTLSPDVTGILYKSSIPGAHPEYTSNGLDFYDNLANSVAFIALHWNSGYYLRSYDSNGNLLFEASAAGSSPEGLTYTTSIGTGTVTVAALTASAQEVIDAINADATASALVTASASGTVTGEVAAVAATNLSGGTGTTTILLPHDGTTGSASITIWNDCLTAPSNVAEFLRPVRVKGGPFLTPVASPAHLGLGRTSEQDYGHDRIVPNPIHSDVPMSSAAGVPQLYHVEPYQADDYASPEYRLRVFPAPASQTLLEARVRYRAPVYTSSDLSLNIPVPNDYYDSIFLPVATFHLSQSRFFLNESAKPSIAAAYQTAVALLATINPQTSPGGRMRPLLG